MYIYVSVNNIALALLIGKTEKILRWIHNAHNIGVFMPEFQEYSN